MVDENLTKGTYESTITNLNFMTTDAAYKISEDLLTVPINVEQYGASIENIDNAKFHAYFINKMLKIESAQVEMITIYSAIGVQLYFTKKNAGAIEIPFSSISGSVYIIKGSKSGTIKVMK
ncbi:MAG: hypothetical protein FWD60_08720 [Candidatus Azobacteroides sp.]|nr:hypothetical protein [Candidatus Azobacteroides sp.]